jgi:hypothetical protein
MASSCRRHRTSVFGTEASFTSAAGRVTVTSAGLFFFFFFLQSSPSPSP